MNDTATRRGFDAAALTQADDHLGRWPLAQEIYGIATTGPDEWSVRIGIYGEWGCGKTSVLNFVANLARGDKHVVIWFNPWQFRGRDELWRGFVLAVLSELGVQLGAVGKARRAKAKEWGGKITTVVGKLAGSAAGFVSEKAGETVESGIGYLARLLDFGEHDFRDVRQVLGDRKIIVLVDDLDRTKPDLVPEILFALKEIMDVPGFVFVCAFDPVVVGEVLGQYHPGFGDGLKFLEKIIDYPRWLPAPSAEGMRALAHVDLARHCDYVPVAAMDDVLTLLPQNPRVLRQFIRLLSLLKPQIERHFEWELRWSIILSANVLKVLYPQLAQRFFSEESVWSAIAGARMMGKMEKSNEDKVGKHLAETVDKVCGDLGMELALDSRTRILTALRRIADSADFWRSEYKTISYQIHVAEAPHAVTWKEYEEFQAAWMAQTDARTADGWMAQHARKVGRRADEVYLEVVDATVRTRDGILSRAADVAINAEMVTLLQQADRLLTLLEQLVFCLGGHGSAIKRFGEGLIKQIIESLFRYADWTGKADYRAMRARERAFLRRFVIDWVGDVAPLMNVLKPFSDMLEGMIGKEAAALRKEVRALVVPRFAVQVLKGLGEQGYVERVVGRGEGTYDIGCILLDASGPLWKDLRAKVTALLAQASENVNVQMNAVEMIHWFDYKMRSECGLPETQAVERLVRTPWACRQLWAAATARPLNPRHVGQLRGFPGRAKQLGINLRLPHWWRRALKELGVEMKQAKAAAAQKQSVS
jgi:hypothetical protein